MITWPPSYSVRTSRRAKRLILQISPQAGLEVIVPYSLSWRSPNNQPGIHALLEEKRRWIEKNLDCYKPSEPLGLPSSLYLLGIQKTIQLCYALNSSERIKVSCKICRQPQSPLCSHDDYLLSGPVQDYSKVFKSLKVFLKRTAIHFLTPWLQALSLETGLSYSSVSFRRQSTLWGSCTASKKISLNIYLLFLPFYLVRYVLLHELCHTQHLNHSKRYWNLLKKFDPYCLQHRKILISARQYLPSWLYTLHE